jgi:hypothetical protein
MLATYPPEVVVIGLGARGAHLAVRSSGLSLELPAISSSWLPVGIPG